MARDIRDISITELKEIAKRVAIEVDMPRVRITVEDEYSYTVSTDNID